MNLDKIYRSNPVAILLMFNRVQFCRCLYLHYLLYNLTCFQIFVLSRPGVPNKFLVSKVTLMLLSWESEK